MTTTRTSTLLAAAWLSLSTAAVADTPTKTQAPATSAAPASAKEISTRLASTQATLRDLWLGHIFWVREVVQGLVHKDPAAVQQAEQQVVANAKQLAGSIEPFYGQGASQQLMKLLSGHYAAVKAHATATVAGNTADAKHALDQMLANADEIAKFLSSANPNLPESAVRSLFAAHGGHHVQQDQQLAAHQLAEEARTWQAMKDHMYVIADTLANAIAKQFPDRF
jgi:hypothetical protein